MRQASLFMFLGPAVVLYLVADVASVRGELSAQGGGLALISLGLSSAPFLWRPTMEPGSRTVAVLGLCLALCFVRWVDPVPLRMSADLALVFGLCGGSVCVLDLAFRVPEGLPLLRRWSEWWPTGMVAALAALVLLVEVAAILPVFETGLGPLLIPPAAGRLAGGLWLAACLAAFTLRIGRQVAAATPDAQAGNGWALLGLWPMMISLLAACAFLGPREMALVLAAPWVNLGHGYTALVFGLLCVWLLFCHGRLVVPEQRVRAAPFARKAIAACLTAGLVFAVGGYLFVHVSDSFAAGGYLALLMAIIALSCYRWFEQRTGRWLAPDRGRLMAALAAAPWARMRGSHQLTAFCGLVLLTLRRGCVSGSGRKSLASWLTVRSTGGATTAFATDVRLYVRHPALEARLDAAGQVHVQRRALSPAIESELLRVLGRPLVRTQLCALRVRAPRLRPLIKVLETLDLLCVLPLVVDGELEGALLLPRAQRRDELSLEELCALQDFAAPVAAQLCTLTAAERARRRAQRALERAQSEKGRADALLAEVLELRALSAAMGAGVDHANARARLLPYSPAMRALLARVAALAAGDEAVLFMAEPGVDVQGVAAELHHLSGYAHGPFLQVDCAKISAVDAAVLIHGEADVARHPGLLRLAAGGTLVLLHVSALPWPVQISLSDAFTTGLSRAVGEGAPAYEVTCRLIASAREDLSKLARQGRVEAGLSRRFAGRQLRVPPLRDRMADMEALSLAALSRACARLSKPAMGISPAAQAALQRYRWPFNESQLEQCMEWAARRCREARVEPHHLPKEIEPRSRVPRTRPAVALLGARPAD